MKNTTAKKRRVFIKQELERCGQVSYKYVEDYIGTRYIGGSTTEDIKKLNEFEASERYAKDEDKIIDRHFTGGNVSQSRVKEEPLAKNVIAEFVRKLVIDSDIDLKSELLTPWKDSSEVVAQIPTSIIRSLDKLKEFWSNSDRRIVLDAGSTNHLICKDIIAHQDLMQKSSLESLLIASNSIETLFEVYRKCINIQMQVIGGIQQWGRTALTGELATYIVESSPMLYWDMAVIGAYNINTESMEVQAQSHPDVLIKKAFIKKSEIRVIAVDASKFNRSSVRSVRSITRIHPDKIDLIVTNSPQDDSLIEDHKKAIQAIYRRGVLVIESDKLLASLKKSTRQ